MALIELHLHTSESSPCGRVPAKKGMTMYREAGYDGVVVTDHFSRDVHGRKDGRRWEQVVEKFLEGYKKAKREGEKLGLKVYLGMELRFPHDENDFLVYGLDEGYILAHPWLYERELYQVYREMNQAGIEIFQAHPFRGSCSPADPKCLSGVEILNGNPRHNSHNDMARAWAKEQALTGICGSDFHQAEDLAGAGICVPVLPESEKELAQVLKAGAFTFRM
ncbi:MAG: PHP domain-containing protein [Hungatella sp.]|nr:PHP domain-containing protein [Hungatella sp.]